MTVEKAAAVAVENSVLRAAVFLCRSEGETSAVRA